MLDAGIGALTFTAIVTALVALILVVRRFLVVASRVTVTVNGDRRVPAMTGMRLLEVLNRAGINLPSACGGVGTCGQCRVSVHRGGAPAAPVEAARLGRRAVAAGVRLACQVGLSEDMAITVADEIFGARNFLCTVRSNRNVASLIKELVLELSAGEEMHFRAGAYVQIACPGRHVRFADFDIAPQYHEEWDRLDLWRLERPASRPAVRAYSMANYPGEGAIVTLNIRIALPPPGSPDNVPPGIVSSYLFSLEPGDTVQVTGPYGHFFARDTDAEMIFIGGGAGMAPLRSHIYDQIRRLNSKRRISFWYGARSRRELFYDGDFAQLAGACDNFSFHPALSEPRPEDGWDGATGFIHDVLHRDYLKDHPEPESCEYYLCGPPLMIHAVRAMLDGLGVEEDSIFFDDFGA